jgi:protein arginine kinase
MTLKWYEQPKVDEEIIISSRIRLARNLIEYPFPSRLCSAGASEIIKTIWVSIFEGGNLEEAKAEGLQFLDLTRLSVRDLGALCERHLISPAMADLGVSKALVFNDTENISIMVNEEDHLRIQSIFVGQDLNAAYEKADKLDVLMSQTLDYAFDKDFGFLTSCPTNTGTGLRASYMLHIPLLEASGALKAQADILTKTGFAIRGFHGEGSESMGSIYQISNQITLGKSEEEILTSLTNLANQIANHETAIREQALQSFLAETKDKVWRALGILTHAHKISLTEAMSHLSQLRLGRQLNLINPPLKTTIYTLMTNISAHNLQKLTTPANDQRHLDIIRADYLRQQLRGGVD